MTNAYGGLSRAAIGAIAALQVSVAAAQAGQSAPLGHPPGTLHPSSVPVDPKAAGDRQRRLASEDDTQVRRTGERDSYGKGRDASRRPIGEDATRLKAERDSRQVNPEAESPNRRPDDAARKR